jgi:hypothetical protein
LNRMMMHGLANVKYNNNIYLFNVSLNSSHKCAIVMSV